MSTLSKLALAIAAVAAVGLASQPARAGDFDEVGVFVPHADAVFFEPFDEPRPYDVDDEETTCAGDDFTLVEDAEYAVEAAVLGEADVVRLQRRLDELETRLLTLELRLPTRVYRKVSGTAKRVLGR